MLSSKDTKPIENKINFGILVIEVVLIMIAVLLGLAANEWRVARAEKKQANHALRYIKNELLSNKNQVEILIDYHASIRDSLKALSSAHLTKNTNISMTNLSKAMPQGFNVPLLEKTGWQLANQTGVINHINYEIAAELSKIYNLQYFYQGKLDKVAENLYISGNVNLKDLSGFTFAIALLANDIVIQEKRLTKLYLSMIEKL